MLLKEIMHPDPVTITPDVSLARAYALVQEAGYRHLPVVREGKVVGIVTDRDLRLATSSLVPEPLKPEDPVEKIMTTPVHTAGPQDPVEGAARVMRDLKIGCLPVMDGGELVGIVTGLDFLDAMIRLIGVHRPSGRLDVRLTDKPGELARLAGLLGENEVNIQSILSYDDGGHGLRLVLRVASIDTASLARTICGAGFAVVWPPHHQCR